VVKSGGTFIVFEAIIGDELRSNAFGLLLSLNTLIETRGGFEYRGADRATWMRQAGLFPADARRVSERARLHGDRGEIEERIDEMAAASVSASHFPPGRPRSPPQGSYPRPGTERGLQGRGRAAILGNNYRGKSRGEACDAST
jgi:hypothetical protein